ncbi:MAG: PQQ-binding-like beta-propeller repeat protein [Roseiflexaceae bacterium]|nr:PQQ-binding-like beta-propeller repeat protein [Roseiflexaceae bacterium]
MQRSVLVISVIVIIGAIAYMATRPVAAPAATPNGVSVPTAAVALDQSTVFGPTQADSGPATSTSSPGDWMMEGSNPARTRTTPAILNIPLNQRREIGIAGTDENASPPVITRGMLLTETSKNLRAFDLATGQQRWVFSEVGSYISPAVAGERVFIRAEADNKGQLYALNLRTGQKLWSFTPRRISSSVNNYYGGHLTSPVIISDVVFVGAGKEVYALDAATGATRWEFAAQDYITSSPAIANGQIYISDFRYVYAIDQQKGTLRWSFPIETAFSFSSVAADKTLLIASGKKLIALDSATGMQRWQLEIAGQSLIPAGADATRAYVKSTETLIALDLATGKELWRFHDLNYVSLPVLSGQHVYVVSGAGVDTVISALDVENGTSIWKQPVQKLANTAPVIAGGAIYVRTNDGRILAFSS